MFADTPIQPAVRGWCPSAFAPMETGDGWIVRARIGGRSVSSEQWAELADVANAFGNGLIEFTMRGNVQVRGVAEHLTNDAAHRFVGVGLAGLDEAEDRRRVVVVNPLARLAVPHDAAVTPADMTACLEDQLALYGDRLPSKWWALVDAETPWPMPSTGCDIALQQRSGTWWMSVAGREVWSGHDPRPEAVRIIERCAELRCRARDLDAVPPTHVHDQAPARTVWWGAQQFDGHVVAAAAPAFGVTTAPALRALTTIAAIPELSIHTTPQRGIVIVAPLRHSAEVDRCLRQLRICGWITTDDDPRRLVSACIGTHGCAASLIDTWQVATDVIGSAAMAERVHVSGCSKRCGAPAGVRELVATGVGIDEFTPSRIEDL